MIPKEEPDVVQAATVEELSVATESGNFVLKGKLKTLEWAVH